jgi:hypothetical protein
VTEPTSFEARAVLGPRRRRLARLTVLLPVVILVAIAGAGVIGARSDRATAQASSNTAVAAASVPVAGSTPAIAPTVAVGLPVHRLDEIRTQSLGPDEAVAVVGWYATTAITDCPALAAIYRRGTLPYVRGDTDELAFCARSGVFYASQPDAQDRRDGSPGLPGLAATVVVGVIMPPDLEVIGADAREVVVVGRFVATTDGCQSRHDCAPELLIDHVAWTPGG